MDSNSEASQLSSPEKREIGLSSSKKVEEQIFIVVHNLELLPKTKTNQDSYICCMPHTYSALGVLSRLVQYDNIHLRFFGRRKEKKEDLVHVIYTHNNIITSNIQHAVL